MKLCKHLVSNTLQGSKKRSDVGKIISDIIQTTSDIVFPMSDVVFAPPAYTSSCPKSAPPFANVNYFDAKQFFT